jgi:UDP-glucose 4-epimerase
MSLKIFITGGSGFIGRNLINHLLQVTNYEIYFCDNQIFSNDEDYSKNSRVHKLCSDLSEITLDYFSSIDVLVHLAAVKKHNVNDSNDELLRTNIFETDRVLRLAAKSNIKKIIFSSSLYANGNFFKLNVKENEPCYPETLYGNSKLFAENLLKELSIEFPSKFFITLRLYFIYGPHQYYGKGYPSVFINTFSRLSRNMPAKIINDGKQKLDYLFIDDLCDLFYKTITINTKNRYEIINASSGKAISINFLINKILKIWQNNNGKVFDGEDFTNNTFRSGSNNKALDQYGWIPKISLEHGLKKFISWYLKK